MFSGPKCVSIIIIIVVIVRSPSSDLFIQKSSRICCRRGGWGGSQRVNHMQWLVVIAQSSLCRCFPSFSSWFYPTDVFVSDMGLAFDGQRPINSKIDWGNRGVKLKKRFLCTAFSVWDRASMLPICVLTTWLQFVYIFVCMWAVLLTNYNSNKIYNYYYFFKYKLMVVFENVIYQQNNLYCYYISCCTFSMVAW